MGWNDLLAAIGGFAALLAAAGFMGKLVAQKVADAALRRLESSLKRAEEVHKSTVALASAIDTDLRTRRIPVYSELWSKTGLLPMWPWNAEVKYQDLHVLTRELRDWYFNRGGIYLSKKARDAYFEVQKCINAILEQDPDGRISRDDYHAIREKCSMLRTELAADLFSRRPPPPLE